MARLTVNYTVTDAGRDCGKVFVLTEMSADKGEAWATKGLLMLINGNVNFPPNFANLGMAGMAEVGLQALTGLKYETVRPLLDEMMECVKVMPDTSRPHVVRDLIPEDIEEIVTRVKLRGAIWNLHADFFKAVAPLLFSQATATA